MTALLLDTFLGRLHLKGVLTTATALHIGAGGSGDPLGTDSLVVRTAAGEPYIPGSSLKGVIRSAAEALFRGGPGQAGKTGPWACETFGNGACGTHEKVERLRKEEEARAKVKDRTFDSRLLASEIWDESCPVCRLFGSLALASRVRIADLPVRGEAPLTELRNGVGIDRDKELAAAGVLYDFEAVPPETGLELNVIVDNPTDEEVGLLLYLFHELDLGHLTLGGKSSRGLGRVRVAWESIEEIKLEKDNPFAALLSSRDLLAAGPAGEPVLEAGSDDLSAKLPNSGDPEAWRALAEILLAMPTIDKGRLGEKAADKGLNKTTLSQKLGLGLDESRSRKAWDVALDRLVASGFLARQGDNHVVAGKTLPETEGAKAQGKPPQAAALQAVIDRYVGAMARLWQEAS